MTDPQIPAGWYPDPAGDATRIRYWDGQAWTDQTQANPTSVPYATEAPDVPVTTGPAATTGPPVTTGSTVPAATTESPVTTDPAVPPVTTGQPVTTEQPVTTGSTVPPAQSTTTPPFQPTYVPGQTTPVYATNPPSTDRKGLAIASLVLGVAGILFCCFVWVGALLGILAIVFGAMSLKSSMRGMAIAGIICGAAGIVLGGLMFIYLAFILSDPTIFSLPNDYVDDVMTF
jgi:hypothetical protein